MDRNCPTLIVSMNSSLANQRKVIKRENINLFFISLFLASCTLVFPVSSPTEIPAQPISTSLVAVNPTITPYIIPTEVFADPNNYVKWLFSINETTDCMLPCWWGLMPGASFEITESVFSPFEFIDREVTGLPEGFVLYTAALPEESPVGIVSYSLFFKEGSLQGIALATSPIHENPDRTGIIKDGYAFDSVIQRYGVPPRIVLKLRSAASEPGDGQATFQLWLLYPDLGTVIVYRGRYFLPSSTEDEIKFCSDFKDISQINVFIQSPNIEFPYFVYELTNGVSLEDSFDELHAIPFMEATGVNNQELVQMIDQGAQLCFQSPKELW